MGMGDLNKISQTFLTIFSMFICSNMAYKHYSTSLKQSMFVSPMFYSKLTLLNCDCEHLINIIFIIEKTDFSEYGDGES